jgi:hypothetical protein
MEHKRLSNEERIKMREERKYGRTEENKSREKIKNKKFQYSINS